MFCKLEISQNSQESTCALQVCNFIKQETLAQVFSCEFRKISKNTFSYRAPPAAASENKMLEFEDELAFY